MNLHGIYHRPKSNYCYAYDKDNIHIRLRGAKGDLKKVTLIYGDKYEWNNHKKVVMPLTLSDKLYDYFTININPENKRLAYYFLVEGDSEKYFYTEWGFIDKLDKDQVYMHFFQYPYINKIDIHKVPDWVKDAVFYQIFPERFHNGDPNNDPQQLSKWGVKPKWNSYYGGDLKGIIDKIDYLKELGINAIYLTPIFKSPTNHKYDTIDYFEIDPNFGDLETFKSLVEKCHENGMKVVLDAVFNHSGFYFKPFEDVREKGEKSPYYDWFHINKWPIETNPPSYDTFAFVSNMPKLNTENHEVREYLLNVGKYWIEECDIDGWRLDVSNEIDHSFWREFRRVIKDIKDDAYIVGEIWHDSLPWLMGDQFDAIMNYPITKTCVDYFAYKNIDETEFSQRINEVLMRNTYQVNEVMLNLLDSHDTSRFLTKSKGNIESLLLAATFMLTFVGAPCIYYGTEIGMEGGEDPDCRRTMDFNIENWNQDVFDYYKKLTTIRNNYISLRRGTFKWIDNLEGVVGYIRELDNEKVYVLINNSESDKVVKIKFKSKKVIELLGNKEVKGSKEGTSIEIPKYNAMMIAEIMD